KKPSTGHAPISRNAMPAVKLITLKNAITSKKPVRLSERCGVSRAENNTFSAASGSKPLPAVIVPQYIRIMRKITRSQRARMPSVRSRPKTSAKAGGGLLRGAKKSGKAKSAKAKAPRPKSPRPKSSWPKALRPWTPAEVREAFSRFQKANPDPRGELEHLNPYTLLVAVVLSAQATDAGVNKATRELFKVADTPQKMLVLGEERLREYIRTIGL